MTQQMAKPLAAATARLELTDRDFSIIQEIARREAGLLLPLSKKVMVQSRLERRVRATGCADLPEYLATLRKDADPRECQELVSALTTNVTSFFREKHHFETLAETVLPSLLRRAEKGGRLRIWSAGCSSGEEPYSLAMLMTKLSPQVANHDVRILATDVDQAVLNVARKGIYKRENLISIASHYGRTDDFDPIDGDRVSIPERLRRLVTFKKLNLHDKWPMRGEFDAIMCRNVVIYFDAEHQAALWPRFYKALSPTGWLFLGHSERIHPLEGSGFVGKGLTTYQKSQTAD